MNNFRIIIIEDEKIAAQSLANLIAKHQPNAQILAIISSIKKAVEWLSVNQVDLIFMDIELRDGQSFEILNYVTITAPIIFTTAYDQYAIKAFKANGIDYLLKPIDELELKNSIDKFKRFIKSENNYSLLNSLFASDRQTKQYKQRFMIQMGKHIRSIHIEEIAYFYHIEKSTFICTFDNDHYSIEYSLDKLEEIIEPEHYYRINRRMLVSLKAINKISIISKSRIKLELSPKFNEDVLVSFNKTPTFKEWLDK